MLVRSISKPFLFLFITFSIFTGCSEKHKTGTFVIIKTKFGDAEIELFPKNAPLTVKAFLSYVDSGYYKNSSFYRVLKAENQPSNSFRSDIIQGGMYQSNYKRMNTLPGIPHESTLQSKLSHTDGTLSMARTAPGTANSEFFICIGNQLSYDYGGDSNPDKLGYAAFGRVVKGMDVINKIYHQPENGEDFDPPVEIINIVRE